MPHLTLQFHPSQNPRRLGPIRLLFVPVFLLAAIALGPPRIAAAELEAKDFDVPAGDASSTLGQFVTQAGAGERVLYSAPEVAGVQTNAVRGRYTAIQAVDLMTTGTVLEALQVDQTGAITIRRRPPPNPRQTAAPEAATQDQEQTDTAHIVEMSRFEVTTTQGHGYVSTTAANGFKTDEPLMNIPQVDIVVTNDLITDINYENSTDVLQYFGVIPSFQGDSTGIRGGGTGYPYIDDMPVNSIFTDNAYVDSYEVIKGPTEVLYLNAPLSGVVIRNTKKPLPFDQFIVTGSVDNNGLYRTTIDLTGPIGKLGDASLGYRLVAVYQHGPTYFLNTVDNRAVVFPELSLTYRNTTVRAWYDIQSIHAEHNGLDLFTPTGQLYTAAGRRESNQPPNNMVLIENTGVSAEAITKISSTWENRFRALNWLTKRYGGEVLATSGYNWATQTEYLRNQLDDTKYGYWSVLDDVVGSYYLGRLQNIDNFGYGFASYINPGISYNNDAPFGDVAAGRPLQAGQPAGSLAVRMNSAAAINAVVVPPASAYNPENSNGVLGNDKYIWISSIYWQHSVEVIPDRFELIGAETWENIQTDSIANLAIQPLPATVVATHQWLHRVGAVLHVLPQVSLYALNSTTFTPSATIGQNGQVLPNSGGQGSEVGFKTNFLGGRVTFESAIFRTAITNVAVTAGVFPNGSTYSAPIGETVETGFDGDMSFTLVKGWQLVGSFYSGEQVNALTKQLVAQKARNQWSFFTRYDFPRPGLLSGVAIGGGLTRIGGAMVSTSGITGYAPGLPATGVVEMQEGTLVNGFVSYRLGKHWTFQVNCDNILNQVYVLSSQALYATDPSPPRTWVFQTTLKF